MLLKNTTGDVVMGNGVYLAPNGEAEVPDDLAKWALTQWPGAVVDAKAFKSPANKLAKKQKDK